MNHADLSKLFDVTALCTSFFFAFYWLLDQISPYRG